MAGGQDGRPHPAVVAPSSRRPPPRGAAASRGELRGKLLARRRHGPGVPYPVAGDIGRGKTFTYSFLRSVPPGAYKLKLVFALPGRQGGRRGSGGSVGARGRHGSSAPRWRPAEASTLPEAEAIVIADEAGSRARPRPGEPEAEDPAAVARGAGRPAAPRGGGRAADHEGRVLPGRQADPGAHAAALLRRDRPRRTFPRKQTRARRRLRRRPGRSSTRTRGRSTRAARGSPCAILPQPDPGGGQGARQGRGPVDRGRRRQEGRALPRREEDRLLDARRPTRRRSRSTEYTRGSIPARDGDRRGRQGSQRHPDAQGAVHDGRERARGRRAAPRLGARQGHALRQGPGRRRLHDPGGRPAAEDDGLRGRREPAADDRPRHRRLGLDGEGDAVRARGVGGALPGPDPRRRTRASCIEFREQPQVPPGADRGLRLPCSARRARPAGAGRDGALRLGHPRPLPVPHAAGDARRSSS